MTTKYNPVINFNNRVAVVEMRNNSILENQKSRKKIIPMQGFGGISKFLFQLLIGPLLIANQVKR